MYDYEKAEELQHVFKRRGTSTSGVTCVNLGKEIWKAEKKERLLCRNYPVWISQVREGTLLCFCSICTSMSSLHGSMCGSTIFSLLPYLNINDPLSNPILNQSLARLELNVESTHSWFTFYATPNSFKGSLRSHQLVDYCLLTAR